MAAATGQAGGAAAAQVAVQARDEARRATGTTVSWRDRARDLLRLRETAVVGVMVCLTLLMTVLQPRFHELANLQDVVRDAGILAILAVGQAVVLITRNLDLSVGSAAGVAAYLALVAMQAFPGLGLAGGFAAAILVGLAVGLVNGLVVVVGRVPSIVATLGSLYALQGLLALPLLAGGGNELGSSQMPPAFLALGATTILGIPTLALAATAVALLAGAGLRFLALGRAVVAVGSSPTASRLVGLPTGRLVVAAFMLSGVTAAIAGFLTGARFGYVGPNTGAGLELDSIAAAVIGGVGILGGTGSPVGAALGALLLGMIANALAMLTVPGVWLQAMTGLFILAAIVLQWLLAQRRGDGAAAS